MTDPDLPVPGQHSGSATPGPVLAAALMTIAAAGGAGTVVLFAAVGYVLVGRAVLDEFDGTDSIAAWFFAVAGILLVLCVGAVVASVGLLRRRRWAWWALLVVTPGVFVLGLIAAGYLVPLAMSAAAAVVFVLLLLPATTAWMASRTA